MNNDINTQINDIFEKNKISDLKKFIKQRQNLNLYNSYLIYFFYIIQSFGILITSISASNSNITLLWIGIGLNILASLIQIFEKINNTKLQKIYKDIILIKNGNYIDETHIIDIDNDINSDQNTKNSSKNNQQKIINQNNNEKNNEI